MDSYGGRTGHTDELLSLPRRCRLMLQAAGLAILLLELSLGISAAQVASTSKAREHVYPAPWSVQCVLPRPGPDRR